VFRCEQTVRLFRAIKKVVDALKSIPGLDQASQQGVAMSSDDPIAQNPSGHLRTLGRCWIIYGVIRLILAVCLFMYGGTATLMFGALLNRVPDPFTLMTDFHVLYTIMIALSAVCGILGIIAGLALLAGTRSGRMLALIAGFLSLSNIPLGTTLGIYTLVVLLPMRAAQLYSRSE
jgi:hypothetical protein